MRRLAVLLLVFAGGLSAPASCLKVSGGDACFLVLTIQEGPAPGVTVEGAGLAARVRVGEQTIPFDGEKVVLAR